MAAGFLMARLLLVCLLSEVNFSSAFPRARSFVQPRVFQREGEEEEVYNYENCHPFYYINAQDKMLEKQGSFMMIPIHICKQNHPSVYQKASNLKPANPLQPRSNIATKWPKETVLPQPPPQKKHLSPKPKSYEFSLKIPFLDFLIRNDGKNSANKKHEGGNDAPAVSKPGFQVSSSVSSSSATQSPNTPTTSHVVHLANQHNPESPDFVKPGKTISAMIELRQPLLNPAGAGYTETQEQPYPIKPQSSSTLYGSGKPFVSFATPHQETHEPVHVKPSSSLAGSARPFLNFGTTQQQTYKPVHVKPPSSSLTELERPFLNFGTTQQHRYEPYAVEPQSNAAIIGLRQPFLNSAGTEAQKPYEPYPIKLLSSSTQAEPARPLHFASPQQHIREPVRVEPQRSNQIGTEWPFVNFGITQQHSYEPYPVEPQSNAAIIESRQPFLNSAGAGYTETQEQPYSIKPQSSATLFGSAKPSVNFVTPHQETHEPVHVKPSLTLAGSARPFLNFGTTQQQTYKPYPVEPPSNAAIIGLRQPFLNSAGTEAQKPYEPYPIKLLSSSTQAEPARPLHFASPQQHIREPVRVEPQRSNQIGTERPLVNFGITQHQSYEPYPIKPQSPQTYEPFHFKPQSSTPAELERPYLNFGTTQQQTYEPYPIKTQSSSIVAASGRPFLNFAALQQQTYEPFHIKPQSSSNQLISDWPALNSPDTGYTQTQQAYGPFYFNSQSTSTHFGSEWPAFNSAAARQNYEPVHVKMQSSNHWPHSQDRSTMSSSQMRVQTQDSDRKKLDKNSDYLKLFDVAQSHGHN